MCEGEPIRTEFAADKLAWFKRVNDGRGPEYFVPDLDSSPNLRRGENPLTEEQIKAAISNLGI